jgi:hypothetical protein
MLFKGRTISKNIISEDQVLHAVYLTERLSLFMELQGDYLTACHKSNGHSGGSSLHYLHQIGLLTFGVMVWQINQVIIHVQIQFLFDISPINH